MILIDSRESLAESVRKDIFTFFMTVGVVGVGVYWQSTTLQVIGVIMLSLGAVSAALRKDTKRYTIAEARQHLDELEGGK